MNRVNSSGTIKLTRVLVKGIFLFLIVNLLFTLGDPTSAFGRFSAYNTLFPGRVRLPYGENPEQAYNLSLYNLDAMYASHELTAGPKPANEYRVLLIGDSSVWGYLLKPDQTLSGFINAANLELAGGKVVRAYNLGYPTLSLAKDLLMLDYALQYAPDLVIWLVTLESFPLQKQLDSPILQNNPSLVKGLIDDYSLDLDPADPGFVQKNLFSSTLVGQRRAIADILRLQIYGILWSATGIDQYYPFSYEPPQEDLEDDDTFHGFSPPSLDPAHLSFDILAAGTASVGDIPIIFINEPVYISHGNNSDIRYNFFYPRWAYDQYRLMLAGFCEDNGMQCLDLWDLVSSQEFTNSAIHMTPAGTAKLAARLIEAIKPLPSP